MGKFNGYFVQAHDSDGGLVIETQVQALSLESAWHKAISVTFEAIAQGTGVLPQDIHVSRNKAASESHG